jgi:hypothetical protein
LLGVVMFVARSDINMSADEERGFEVEPKPEVAGGERWLRWQSNPKRRRNAPNLHVVCIALV